MLSKFFLEVGYIFQSLRHIEHVKDMKLIIPGQLVDLLQEKCQQILVFFHVTIFLVFEGARLIEVGAAQLVGELNLCSIDSTFRGAIFDCLVVYKGFSEKARTIYF